MKILCYVIVSPTAQLHRILFFYFERNSIAHNLLLGENKNEKKKIKNMNHSNAETICDSDPSFVFVMVLLIKRVI